MGEVANTGVRDRHPALFTALALTDAAVGADLVALVGQVAAADAAHATDALSLLIQIALTETPIASEALTALVQLSIVEEGAATDEVLRWAVGLSLYQRRGPLYRRRS